MTTKQLTRRQARWSLFLAEFRFNLAYRPGSHNGKADRLSRRPDFKDWPLLIADFLQTDAWLPNITDTLRENCVADLPHYQMVNDTFCRILADGRSKVPYLPSWERNSVYKRFHQGLGHLKFDSIYELVARRYWWATMKQDIKDAIRRCPECQLDQSAAGSFASTPIRPIPSVAQPFERWGVDFIQDLPETKAGNRHIVTAIDYATRWVVAKAVPNRDSATVASFLYDLMVSYGSPFEILTDRGSAFLSEGVKEFEALQRIRHHATTPYHPRTNGMVERMHAMETCCNPTFSVFLLYGVDPRLPGDTAPPRETMMPLDQVEQMEERAEFNARSLEEIGQVRSAAYATLPRRKQRQCESGTSGTLTRSDYYFKIGEW
ncbi:hypothetical protein BASA83_010421 [Batrachochytrium salamandrivorans]|nr:hypothetical protein BASA83_010421 [Batrachochytrium salamandrivorans]